MVKTEPSYTVGGDINLYSHCGGQYGGSHSWKYIWEKKKFKKTHAGFPGGQVVKNPPASAGDMGLIPGLGRPHMPQSN